MLTGRTHALTDGQPENIMPLPHLSVEGGGIKNRKDEKVWHETEYIKSIEENIYSYLSVLSISV